MPTELSDERLVALVAAERCRDAFAELFRRYAARVAGILAKRNISGTTRDELVQEVMLKVWHRAEQYDSKRAKVSTWVFRIASNTAIDHQRRRWPQVEPLDPVMSAEDTPRADQVVVQQQTAHRVREAVEALPTEQAAVLSAAYFEHKSLREVAEEQGIPLGTVKSRVRLAFKRLRTVLGGET